MTGAWKAMILPVLLHLILNCQKDLILKKLENAFQIIWKVITLEAQTLARACGKSHLRNLEPEDLVL